MPKVESEILASMRDRVRRPRKTPNMPKELTARECQKANNRELAALCELKITEAFGSRVKMFWGKTACHGVQRIVYKYQIEVRGWPEDMPFEAPSNLKRNQVEFVLRNLRKGNIWFQKLNEEEMAAYKNTCHPGKGSDCEASMQTRLGRRAKKDKKAKTSEFITEED